MQQKIVQQSLLASGGLFASANVTGRNEKEKVRDNGKPFYLNYGIHDGTFKNLAGTENLP